MVKGSIPSNCVAAGVPCKPIMSLEDFYDRRLVKYEEEAFLIVNEYIKHYGKKPSKEILHEFFFLFEDGNELDEIFDNKLLLCGNKEESLEILKKRKPKYKNFDSFLKAAIESGK